MRLLIAAFCEKRFLCTEPPAVFAPSPCSGRPPPSPGPMTSAFTRKQKRPIDSLFSASRLAFVHGRAPTTQSGRTETRMASAPENPEVTMSANRYRPVSRPARRFALFALVAAMLGCAIAVPTSLANTGSVYWDNFGNTAAGRTLFNGTNSGSFNTGLGIVVLPSVTTGSDNSLLGNGALQSDTAGSLNTAIGSDAMESNTSGQQNTAVGDAALDRNVSGDDNVATGSLALFES